MVCIVIELLRPRSEFVRRVDILHLACMQLEPFGNPRSVMQAGPRQNGMHVK